MALLDFWSNVRTAARMIAPRAIVDAPRLDAGEIERALRGATFWLTRGAVAGYDEADFSFLPEAERARLTRLVTEFREVASTVKPAAPAPESAVEKALPLFLDIVNALEFERYGDAEAFRLGKLIEQALEPHRPPELAELRFNTRLDHTGDPGLWIWAFLSDDVSASDETFLKAARVLRKILDTVAREVTTDRWPYISFRSLAEESQPVEA